MLVSLVLQLVLFQEVIMLILTVIAFPLVLCILSRLAFTIAYISIVIAICVYIFNYYRTKIRCTLV